MTRLTPAQLTTRRIAYYAQVRALAPMMARKGWRYDRIMTCWVPKGRTR